MDPVDSSDELKAHKEEINRIPPHRLLGTPRYDLRFRKIQPTKKTCGIAAQAAVIHKRTGEAPALEDLLLQAKKNHWAEPDGMIYPRNMGKLLAAHNVPVEETWIGGGATLQLLCDSLNQHRDVIVAVDSNILYEKPWSGVTGHALCVTGVELDADLQPKRIFVIDGYPSSQRVYDVDHFMAAWEPLGCAMVRTQRAATREGDR